MGDKIIQTGNNIQNNKEIDDQSEGILGQGPDGSTLDKYANIKETIYSGKHGNFIKLGLFSALAKYTTFTTGGGTGGSLTHDGLFKAGELPIPAGFYPDKVLHYFITHAEGRIGVHWVRTDHGHDFATDYGCGGYDYAGGVHVMAVANKIGVTPQEWASWVTDTNRWRPAIAGERKGGVVGGWFTTEVPPEHIYWARLMPYYRDKMIWAWNHPEVQAIKDPAERLCRMHMANWGYNQNIKGMWNSLGYTHRKKVADDAVALANMGRFS